MCRSTNDEPNARRSASRTAPLALLLAALIAFAPARGDVLRTLDGRTLEGQVRFDAAGDAITMQQSTGSAVRVKLADVLSASFRPAAPTTAPSARAGGGAATDREPIRAPWTARDVGRPVAGSTRRTATKVTLAGGTLNEVSDSIAFFNRAAKGNFELIVRVADVGGANGFGGIMLRGGPEPDAPMIFVGAAAPEGNADRGALVLKRLAKGQNVEGKGYERTAAPLWLRAVRNGEYVDLAKSTDGQTWTDIAADRVPLSDTLLVGVATVTWSGKPEPAKNAANPPGGVPAPAANVQATFESLRLVETPVPANGGLRAQYFAGQRFEEAKATRVDPKVDFNWGAGSPDPAVPADKFSARWTGMLNAPVTGKYTFFAKADDKVELWVGGQKVSAQGGTVWLRMGRAAPIRVEYVENGGTATVQLEWQAEKVPRQVIEPSYLTPADAPTGGASTERDGLRAEYFSDADLSQQQLVRTDAQINFQQQNSPADESLNTFSVRWTGQVTAPTSGKYTFYTFSDDGVRLRVNNRPLVDNWQLNPGVEDSGTINLEAGKPVPIRMESFNAAGGWAARLMWEGPDVPKQVVPADHFIAPSEAVDTRLLTRDGTELIGIAIDALDDTTVRFKLPDGTPTSLPVDRVARLSVHPLTRSLLAKVPAGSQGVLLKGGDFFEGQIERLEKGTLSVNSLIFGPRTFKLQGGDLVAIVLQDARPEPADYVVRTIDGSVYMASAIGLEGGKLAVTDRAVGKVTVTPDALRDVTYGGPRVQPLEQLPATVTASGSSASPTDARGLSIDGTPVGLPMKLFDSAPQRGIGLMSGAAATFALDGQYRSLLTTVGVPAAMMPVGGVHFVALADGKEIYRSPLMNSLSDSAAVSLKVDKAASLTLKVEAAEARSLIPTPGLWGDPLLTKP